MVKYLVEDCKMSVLSKDNDGYDCLMWSTNCENDKAAAVSLALVRLRIELQAPVPLCRR